MALVAVATRGGVLRKNRGFVAAFSTAPRTFATKKAGVPFGALNGRLFATVESDTEASAAAVDDDFDVVFPLQGKRSEECPPRMRFAPSPTGSLHVGGARTALYNWLVAKKGQLDFPGEDAGFVLRVEDTDLARSTKESEESVLADLRWLGLAWDEGPDMEGERGPYRQSERGELYQKVAKKLIDEGIAYPCFCTKEELEEMKAKQEAEGIPPRYDGTWRDADPELVKQKMEEGVPYTIRFKVPAGARVVIDDAVRGTVSWDAESTVGDFILLRSNGVPVYNFCVAVDDATMGITTVIRAEEHLTNTLRQGLILDALNAPRPRYAHCSLILGSDTKKLSKRHGATSCNQFRLDGFLPDAMINYLALLGWNDGTDNEIFTRDELVDAFGVDRVVKSPSIFDMDKLKWINSQHLKMMSIEEVAELVKEQMDSLGILEEGADGVGARNVVFATTALAKQMMETTQDAATNAQAVLGYGLPESFDKVVDAEAKSMIQVGHFFPIAQALIKDFESGSLPQPDPADPLAPFLEDINQPIEEDNKVGGTAYSYPKAYKVHMKNLSKELGVKGKNLFHPLRLALTGEMSGQDVTKQMALLGMASAEDTCIDTEKVGVVSTEQRMERLKAFCETIPEEFRAPKTKEDKTKAKADAKAAEEAAQANAAAAPAVVDPLDTYDGPPITALDIRVGRITKVWEHPEADKLFCEEVDLGEDEPRQIASGLRPYMNAEDMEGRMVLVLANLKARKMLGFPSHGMVLCASNEDHTEVKFVSPPVDAKVGERVTVPGFDFEGEEGNPFAENKIGKKKIFEKLAPHLVTNEFGSPEFLGRPFLTSAGVCTSPIEGGNVA
uniref:glutamate--tRNA ligase n=1 Tax=Odontella aurita TaxID=265563 RepID=A0A7S4I3J1_9STRA